MNKMTKVTAQATSFKSSSGTDESFFVLHPSCGEDFAEQMDSLDSQLTAALEGRELTIKEVIFCRFFLSDVANQHGYLIDSELYHRLHGACRSVVEQPPLAHDSLVGLLVYCISGDKVKTSTLSLPGNLADAVRVETDNYELLWTSGHTGTPSMNAYHQTDEIFKEYTNALQADGMTMLNNAVRTWIYVRDIDNHYQGMVDARRVYFDENNMSEDTHYIASTGIEARVSGDDTLVYMDTLSVKGFESEQVVQMDALEHMSRTRLYDVTFERGTELTFGDRKHYYISGTASINKHGEVVHIGNVAKQTRRAMENVRALLEPYGGKLDHLAYLIVYLRNPNEHSRVSKILKEELPAHVPFIIVRGAVCRPTWLIEVEGIAINLTKSDFPNL